MEKTMSEESTPCGAGGDDRYCPAYWRLDAEGERLRGAVGELLENSGLDDDMQAEWLARAGIDLGDGEPDGDDGPTNRDVDPDACDAADGNDFGDDL